MAATPTASQSPRRRRVRKRVLFALYVYIALAILAPGLYCSRFESDAAGDVFVIGDLSTVGATLWIDGRRIRTLVRNPETSRWNSKRSEKDIAQFRRWVAFRDSMRLGRSEELRLKEHWWTSEDEWTRVLEDERGRVKIRWLGDNWVKMELDSVVVHEHLLSCLPRGRLCHILLVSAHGESLSVDIHAYKYPGVMASFSQGRIESDSWEEWP